MGTIRALLRGFQSIRLEQQIPKIIESDAELLANYNKDQLNRGLTSKGEEISPGYASPIYESEKNALNPLPGLGVPDLKLTGAFYGGFNVTAGYTGIFTFDSSDSKTPQLEAKYGKYIFGLTNENKKIYATTVFVGKLQDYITGATGLRFR